MALIDTRKGDTLEHATFDDIIINNYGERGRIIGETPAGHAWIVLKDKSDSRRIVYKYDALNVIVGR